MFDEFESEYYAELTEFYSGEELETIKISLEAAGLEDYSKDTVPGASNYYYSDENK